MLIAVLKETWRGFNEDKVTRLASAIAFATVFALIPLFVVMIAAGSAVFGFETGNHSHRAVEDTILRAVRERAGAASAQTIEALIDQTYSKPHQTEVARLLGWATLIVGAGGLFGALQDALNTIWQLDKRNNGIRQLIRDRIAGYIVFLLLGALLIAFFLANLVITVADIHFTTVLPAWTTYGGTFIGAALTILVLNIVFMTLFKVLPDIDMPWSQAWHGATITSVFFFAGQVLIAVYFSRGGILTTYGAAGSILVALLWVYYSALIFLIGAEITKALGTTYRQPPGSEKP